MEVLSCLEMSLRYHKVKDWHLFGDSSLGWRLTAGSARAMRSGKTFLNHTQFLGYTKGSDGILQIVPEEAGIVRTIFDLYVQGNGVRKIKKYLESHSIKAVTGKSEWSTFTIGHGCRVMRSMWAKF